MQFINDVIEFLKSLTFVDYVFFLAVLVLMVLITTLFYFIKINDDVLKKNDKSLDETQEMKIVKELTKDLEKKEEPRNIAFTDYEKDQEEKAIISYDELLKKDTNYEINYENEEFYDDLSVKKFDLDNLTTEKAEPLTLSNGGRAISYAKEEAFLKALQELQKGLH